MTNMPPNVTYVLWVTNPMVTEVHWPAEWRWPARGQVAKSDEINHVGLASGFLIGFAVIGLIVFLAYKWGRN